MKSVATAILTFILITVAACQPRPDVDAQLDQAELLMDAAPDSALILLNEINGKEIDDRKENARYALLYSQALDKNYIDIKDDSLIRIAADYFKDHGTTRNRMLTCYYHGRVKCNSGNYPQSICLMLRAFELARQEQDFFWMGRSADEIADLYQKTLHNSEELHYAEIALENMRKANRQPYLNYSMYKLAQAYNNNRIFDKSIPMLHALIDSAKVSNDTLLYRISNEVLARSEFGAINNDETIKTIEKLDKEGLAETDVLGFLAMTYYNAGRIDDAMKTYNRLASDSTTLPDFLIHDFAKRRGDYRTAHDALYRIYTDDLSTLTKSLNENLAQAISEHYAKTADEEKEKLKQEKRNVVILITALVLMLLLTVIYSVYRNKRIIAKNIMIAQNFHDIISVKDNQYNNSQAAIRELIGKRFEIIDKLCKTYYESQSTSSMKKRISDEVSNLIDQFSSDKEKITELEAFINKHNNNVIERFKNDLPNLKEADYLLFLYSALSLSSTAIALFLHEDKVEAVYNRKKRLKLKLKQLDNEKAEEYIAFLK